MSDHSISDFSEHNELQPDYWISKWTYDESNGFGYELSDGSTGMLFHEGLNLKRIPDKM